MRTLILFGFKGSGKSTYGKLLAEQTKTPFLDTDHLLGSEPRTLFKQIGEKEFRAREAKAIQQITSFEGVIALGGGAIFEKETQLHLKKLGQLVYLEASKETIKTRMLANGLPAFLESIADFDEMYDKLLALYKNIQALKVNTEHTNVVRELTEIMNGKQ